MKIKISRLNLLSALGHAMGVVSNRNTIPILSTVLLRAEHKLTVTATDLERSISEDVEAETLEPGSCTTPAAMLHDFVKRLPADAEVLLSSDGKSVTARSGRCHVKAAELPVEDFPSIDAGKFPCSFSMPAVGLRRLIDHTIFAMSDEETRYYLNGIFLQAAESDGTPVLRAVSTDGHRLARADEPRPDGVPAMDGIIIPRAAVSTLRKLLDGFRDGVGLEVSDRILRATIGPLAFTTKLVDGTFPEYDRVIPRDNDKVLRVGKADFVAAIGRVAVVSDEKACPVKLAVGSITDKLRVSCAASSAEANAEDEISATYRGAALEVGFQAKYLADVAEQIAGDMEFRFMDPSAPALVVDPGDSAVLYVIMPMRVV